MPAIYLVKLFGAVSEKLRKGTKDMQMKGVIKYTFRQSNVNISHDILIRGQNTWCASGPSMASTRVTSYKLADIPQACTDTSEGGSWGQPDLEKVFSFL